MRWTVGISGWSAMLGYCSITCARTLPMFSCRADGKKERVGSKDSIASSHARLDVRNTMAGMRCFCRRASIRSTGCIEGGIQLHTLRNDNKTGFSDFEALRIGGEIVSNLGLGRDTHVLVDDSAPDAALFADHHIFHDHRLPDIRVVLNTHVGGEDRGLDSAAGDDAPATHNRVQGDAHAAALVILREHELGRRELALISADGPLLVVEIEQ